MMLRFDAAMEDWEPTVVGEWMKQVTISPDVISALGDVDGDGLKSYTLDDLVEDTGITRQQGRKILYLRDEYLTVETESKESGDAEAVSVSSSAESSDSSLSDSSISDSQCLADVDESFTDDNEGNLASNRFSVSEDSFLQEMEFAADDILTKEEKDRLERLILGQQAGFFGSSYFPILVTSSFTSREPETNPIREYFNFLSAVNWCCVFDCDPRSNLSGMCNFIQNTRPVKIQNLNLFENVRDIERLRSDLEFPDVPAWLFTNGREDLSEKIEERHSDESIWLQQRGRSAFGAVRFFTNQALINRGRERVLFLLMSEQDAFVMSQLFREFMVSCPDFNYTVLAKNEEVYRAWKTRVVSQSLTHEDQMDARSIVGGKWISINSEVEKQLGDIETSSLTWPHHRDSTIPLRKRDINGWSDLTVVGSNHCENTAMTNSCPHFDEFVKSKQEKFYRGDEVEWWNLYFTEKSFNNGLGYNHVLKREPYSHLCKSIRQLVNIHVKSDLESVNIDVVTIFHQPGSGGTTLGKQMLWEFRKDCRCVVVDKLSSNTADQLMKCLRYGFDHGGKMQLLLVLIDNSESTAVFNQLIRDTHAKAKSENPTCKTVIFLHCQRTNAARTEGEKRDNQPCVCLQHTLSKNEHKWFNDKLKELESKKRRSSCSPEKLLGFMALKAEHKEEYFDKVVEHFLPTRNKATTKALDLLKYIAIIQKYVPQFAVPVKTCDELMPRPPISSMRSTAWEKRMPEFLQVMLIEKRVKSNEGRIQCLATVGQSFAKAVVKRMALLDGESQTDMVSGLIDSPILQSYAHGIDIIKKSLRDLFVHRKDNPTGRGKATQFSLFLEETLPEGKQEVYNLLDSVVFKFHDAFVAQQLARVYLKDKMYDEASGAIDKALQLWHGNNSHMLHTKGRIYDGKLSSYQKQEETGHDPLAKEQVNELCAILKEAMDAFTQCQQVSAKEPNETRNLIGFEGEAHAIFSFLYIIKARVPPFNHSQGGLQELTTYLTNPLYIPKGLKIDEEYHQLVKGLGSIIDNDINFLADTKDHCIGKSSSQESSVIATLEKRRKLFFLSMEGPQMTLDHQRRTKAMSLLIGSRYRDIFTQAKNTDNIENLRIVLHTLAEVETLSLLDVRTLTFVSFALSTLHDYSLPERIWEWVAELTKLEEKHNGLYGLFFQMLLCWLSETPEAAALGDIARKLQEKWNSRYSAPNVNAEQSKALLVRPIKKIPSTEFFLGVKDDQKCLVHKSKKIHAYDRPRGILEDKYNLLYKSGLTGPMYIKLALSCKSSPSNEAVTFTLGFSLAGPRAHDVITCDSKTPVAGHSDRLHMPAYLVKYEEQLSVDSGFDSAASEEFSDF